MTSPSKKAWFFANLDSLFGEVLRTREVVIANDPTSDSRRGGLPDGHPPLGAFLGVPLMHDGEMIGMAGVANRLNGYDESLLAYLETFLASCATMLSADLHQRRRRQAEQRLSQQQAQLAHVSRLTTLGEMLAGIAHEITQPLGAINNYAGAVATQLESGQPNQAFDLGDWSRKISEQATRAGKIIERLRSFARRSEPQLSEVALEEVIEEAIELVQPYARRQRTNVIWTMPESPCLFTLDRLQIQQVVVNLINNACEAMATEAGSRREVEIQLTFEATGAMISVADDGPGLLEEDQYEVFEAFFTTKSQGLGMGLAICRSVVESHNGRIWFTPNQQRGTTFWVKLPKSQTSTL